VPSNDRSTDYDSRITACGDDLISVAMENSVSAQQFATQLRATGTWMECVPGIESVVVQFDAARTDVADVTDELIAQLNEDLPAEDVVISRLVLPVFYDGPDLLPLCEQLGMSRDELVALHCGGDYRVEMLGFTPGFAYVGGLDDRLNVPRLAEPRQHIAAGSIGIAGGKTGIYALSGPGGWPLIGRTPLTLFDTTADNPFVLSAGMRIRFEPLDGDLAE